MKNSMRNRELEDRIAGLCMANLFLAVTGKTVNSKAQLEQLSKEALERYNNDPHFNYRVDRLVSGILQELDLPANPSLSSPQ